MPTDVVSPVQNPPRIDDASMGGRLFRATASNVEYQQWASGYARVNGETIDLSTPFVNVLGTTNLVAADGTDAGASSTTDTTYYVYLGNSQSIMGLGIWLSATAPSFANGVLSLGATAATLPYRYVGILRTNATGSGQIEDSDTRRDLVNHYNRQRTRLFVCPGYSDNDANTAYNAAGAAWALMHAAAQVFWISDGLDGVDCSLVYLVSSNGAGTSYLGLGISTTANPTWGAVFGAGSAAQHGQIRGHATAPARGTWSYFAGLAFTTGGVNLALLADLGANGAAADLAATYLLGNLWT